MDVDKKSTNLIEETIIHVNGYVVVDLDSIDEVVADGSGVRFYVVQTIVTYAVRDLLEDFDIKHL